MFIEIGTDRFSRPVELVERSGADDIIEFFLDSLESSDGKPDYGGGWSYELEIPCPEVVEPLREILRMTAAFHLSNSFNRELNAPQYEFVDLQEVEVFRSADYIRLRSPLRAEKLAHILRESLAYIEVSDRQSAVEVVLEDESLQSTPSAQCGRAQNCASQYNALDDLAVTPEVKSWLSAQDKQ